MDRKCADVADELTNDGITKPVVIEIENVLDNLTNKIHIRDKFFSWQK